MMKVLVADKFEKVGLDGLRELNCNVQYAPDLTAADLPAKIKEFDPKILIVRSKKVNAEALEAGAALSVVIRAGAGIDTIDVAAASRLGVFVTNCPGKNSIAVAELVMGLILSLDRRIADQVGDLRAGKWNKGEYSRSRGLHGRTLGIVGLGQIGREIARRAQAFGMRVVAWSRQLTIEDATRLAIGYCQTPIEVAQQSDIVSINVAATGETRHLVNRDFLTAMRPGPSSSTPPAAPWWTRRRSRRRSSRRGSAPGSMSTRTSRPAPPRSSAPPSPNCRACTVPITSGPPPSRPRWRSPTR